MRSLVVVCVAVGLALFSVTGASAAAPAQGQVSNQMLAAMGMSGMQQLSDTQGEQIRGKGWIIAVNFVYIGSVEKGGNVTVVQNLNVQGHQTNFNTFNSFNSFGGKSGGYGGRH